MNVKLDEIQIRGRSVLVPATEIDGRTVVLSGRWLKVAAIKDEDWVEGTAVSNPEGFVDQLRSSGLRADIFTFPEALDVGQARLSLPFDWDNVAAVRTSDFQAWWDGLPQESRKNVRRAAKRGVVVKSATLDDAFVAGIKRIYDESPLRQGRPFWHHGKPLERIKTENGTYIDRSEFIGAYHDDELIGFMKWVYVGEAARIMQLLSLSSHSDKRPMNALMAKAIEICHERGKRYLIYGKFTYGNKKDTSIGEFKRRMGFEQIDFPRYYAPLTLKGNVTIALRLHRGLIGVLPAWFIAQLLAFRSRWLQRRAANSSNHLVDADGRVARSTTER